MYRSIARTRGGRILCVMCAVGVVVALGWIPSAGQQQPAAPTRTAEAIRRSIGELRRAQHYGEAADSARVLVAKLQEVPGAKAWEIAAAQDLLRTAEEISRLSHGGQVALAQADRLDAELRECEKRGDWAAGVTVARQQLALREQYLGSSHPEVARSLSDLATFLYLEGHLGEAEATARRALQMGQEQLHPDSPSLARRQAALGRILLKRGDYAGAEACLKEELAIHRRAYPEGHRWVAMSTSNVAILYYEIGDFAQAEVYFDEAIADYRQRVGTPDAQLAKMLLNQGLVHRNQGDFTEALASLRTALEIHRRVFEATSPEIASALAELAETFRATGTLDSSLALCKEALTLRQAALPADHPDIMESWRFLGDVLAAMGDHARADSAYAAALTTGHRIWPGGHPTVAGLLHAQAKLLMTQGRHPEAMAVLARALDMMRTWKGRLHPDVAAILRDMGVCCLARGELREAEQQLAEAARIFESTRLRAGLGYERATFQESPYGLLAATRLRLGETATAWTATEHAHARALADLMRKNTPAARSPEERARERALHKAITLSEAHLESLRVAVSGRVLPEGEARIAEAYASLLHSQAEFDDFTRQMAENYPLVEGRPFPLSRVSQVLGEDEAIVGWLWTQRPDSLTDVWAYVLRRAGPVQWVSEIEAQPLSQCAEAFGLLDHYRETMALAARFGPTRSSHVACGEMAAQIWRHWLAPLAPLLRDVQQLVVVPSGPMRDIPIEALLDTAGAYACDRYSVSYTPSATVLAFLREQPPARRPPGQWQALLIGDPPFNAEQLRQMESEAAGLGPCGASDQQAPDRAGTVGWTPFQPTGVFVNRAFAGDASTLDSLPRLCASRAEVDSIARAIPGSTILLGAAASEQGLVTLGDLTGFDVFHLATHALVDDERPERSALILSRVGLPSPLDAMTPCGQILDGRLTADEISSCMRFNAKLVTLSGCQTALGKPSGGEGHIGLAHAFLQAGARNLIVSLWQVGDQPAAVFMRSFYRNLLREEVAGRVDRQGGPGSISRALSTTRRDMRAHTDAFGDHPYTHPVHWAGFVLIGAGN